MVLILRRFRSTNEGDPSVAPAEQSHSSMIAPPEIIEEARLLAPVVCDVVHSVGGTLRAGMSTAHVAEKLAEALRERDIEPAMLGYNGYPHPVSISVNNEVVHGFPSERRLVDGDFVTVQITGKKNRAFAGLGWTFVVGGEEHSSGLYRSGETAIREMIDIIGPSTRIGTIGACCQARIEGDGYSVVSEYCGYGMGEKMIQGPQIPCFGREGIGMRVKPGMLLNLHVIANEGESEIEVLDDGWTTVTRDSKKSVLFTAMVLVQESGSSLLTPLP